MEILRYEQIKNKMMDCTKKKQSNIKGMNGPRDRQIDI